MHLNASDITGEVTLSDESFLPEPKGHVEVGDDTGEPVTEVVEAPRGSGTGPALTGVIDLGRISKVGCVGTLMSL